MEQCSSGHAWKEYMLTRIEGSNPSLSARHSLIYLIDKVFLFINNFIPPFVPPNYFTDLFECGLLIAHKDSSLRLN